VETVTVVAPRPRHIAPGARLSRRELDVLQAIVEWHTNCEIADALFLSRRTIDDHLIKIFARLGVSTRREAVRIVRDQGLLPS
jgi:DNA-binding NarL/FixJ family response regulator